MASAKGEILKDPVSSLQKRISNINWNQVYYFSLVATYGSIKRASEILRLSSSTLSEHISQLEAHLNVELFSRRGPKLELTEQGNRLFIHAKGMFEHSQRLLDAVSPLRLGCYPVSIGFIPGPHLPLAYQWVAHYREKHGSLNMKLQHCSPDGLEKDLIQGRLDFGFSDKKPERGDLRSVKVATNPIRFYVSKRWSDSRLAEILEAIPLLICRSEASTEAFVERALRRSDLVPSSIVTSDFPSALIDLCLQGLGVGAFCEDSVSALTANHLRSLRSPKGAPAIESSLYIIWATDAENTAAVAHLIDLIDSCRPKDHRVRGLSTLNHV